jgi:hypothetical protein
MLLNFSNSGHGLIIDPSEFKETLSVRISIPMEYQLKNLNGRHGIFKEKDNDGVVNSNDGTWITPEPVNSEDGDFDTFIINQSSNNIGGQTLKYKYTIYAFNSFKQRIVAHDLILVELYNELWHVIVNSITIILPDYNFIEKIHYS